MASIIYSAALVISKLMAPPGSKPSASYFKRDFCTAYLHQKVPKISELFDYKKSSRVIFQTMREQLFVEITGKSGILAQ